MKNGEHQLSLVEKYEILNTKYGNELIIDGQRFPYHLHEDGPHVQHIDPELPMHILWLPVLVDSPIPAYAAEPPGERLTGNDEE